MTNLKNLKWIWLRGTGEDSSRGSRSFAGITEIEESLRFFVEFFQK
jgi:hypothetical protein